MVLVSFPPQSYIAWQVVLTLLHTAAISSTIYRAHHRFKIHRLWWDDYIAILPLLLDVYYSISIWLRFPHHQNPIWSSRSQEVLNSYWLTTFPYILIVWSTRVVLCLSLARIFPEGHRARKWSLVLTGTMIFALLACLLVTTTTCNPGSGSLLRVDERRNCVKGIRGSSFKNVFMFVADFLGDILLIGSPLIFFWRIRLPRRERRLILMVFCGSILTFLAALAFMAMSTSGLVDLGPDRFLILAALAHIEAAVSIFVCNLVVVSTCLYQTIYSNRRALPESAQEELNPRGPYSDGPMVCTCTVDDTFTATLTLTEISDLSSLPASMHTHSIHSTTMSLCESNISRNSSEVREKARSISIDSRQPESSLRRSDAP